MGDRPVAREGQGRHLRRRERSELLPVGVAEVEAVEAAEPIDVALAVVVEDERALAADDHGDLLRGRGHVGEVQHQVLLGEVLKLGHRHEHSQIDGRSTAC